MTTRNWSGLLAIASLALVPTLASARPLSLELWTDRGADAVYQPGDPIQIKTRISDDAYMLVYEIDAEGRVNLLFPTPGSPGSVEGRRTYYLPDDGQNELVVDQTTGQGYIVAIASHEPFEDLPWYLRPLNNQGEGVGYYGKPDDEEGLTSEGKIVGDPFVAMERIRRRIVHDDQDPDAFTSAYVSYYVHDRVRYPRYICNDCHRPGRYAWWDGFDPYYTTCSVFDFRVNWSWTWGPRYWCGSVPYFVYVYRPDCPPSYRSHSYGGVWYSSWDGWNRWCELWGNGGLRRYKSPPPVGYSPPPSPRERDAIHDRTPRPLPPGFLAGGVEKRGGIRQTLPIGAGDEGRTEDRRTPRGLGRDRRDDGDGGGGRDLGGGDLRPGFRGRDRGSDERAPRPSNDPPGLGRSRDEGNRPPRIERRDAPWGGERRESPRIERREPQRYERREAPPPPRFERREAPPPPRYERAPDPPRYERREAPPPRVERAPEPRREERRDAPPPREEKQRGGDDRGNRGDRGDRGNGGGGRRER